MTKVLIQNGKVHEIFGNTVPPLTPELVAQIVDAPPAVKEGWLYNGVAFTPPPPRPPRPPDRNIPLDTAIGSATTLAQLKVALLGKVLAR